MPAPIRDEYAAIPSRQVRYQRRNRAEGLCILCRVPTEHDKLHCADCIKRTKEKRAKTQRLHRAAPELLKQLRETLECLRGEHSSSSDAQFQGRFALAYAAIAAAEGEK